jgi:ankyrin repeat protein
MEETKERVDIMERKGNQLYEMISNYVRHRKRPIDEKRINEQIGYGFFHTDRMYGMFNDTLLTEALNAGLEKASLALAKYGARANIGNVNTQGDYALLLACKKKYKDVVFELLKHKGNPCTPNNVGETPLMMAVVDINMIDIVPALLKHCDVNYVNDDGKDAMELVFEVGNFEAFKLLINDPKTELKSYDYELDGHLMKLTLLEYIYVTEFGNDYSENHKHARELLKVKGIDCFPLHIQNERKITALMFAIGDSGENVDDALHVIRKLLHFAEVEKNIRYVDFKNADGLAAFDLLFLNALEDGKNVDVRIIKLFIDYYYKNNKQSRVFHRNIPIICNNAELFEGLKKLFPESKQELLDNACQDIVETNAVLTVPLVQTPSPGIQTGRRTRRKSKKRTMADEIHIVNAIERENPLPLWAQVGDTRERGIRQTKRWRVGGKKDNKTRKHK